MATTLGGKQLLVPDYWATRNGVSPKAVYDGKNFRNATWNGNVGFPPPETGCVLYMPGNPAQGSIIKDFSGSANHGTITGAVWTRLPSGLWYPDFDTSDDGVNCGTGASLDITTQITIEAWLYPRTAGGGGLGRIYEGIGSLYRTFFTGANVLRFDIVFAVLGGQNIWTNANSFPYYRWTKFTGTYDGATMKSYANATLQTATYSGADTMTPLGASNLLIGKTSDTSRTWDGGIALFRVHAEIAKTQAQITNDFNRERHLFGV